MKRKTTSRPNALTTVWLVLSGVLFLAGCGSDASAAQHEKARGDLSMELTGIEFGCATDPTGESALVSFHPKIADRYREVACEVTADTINAFGDEKRSTVASLDDSALSAKATELSLDPKSCFLFTSGRAKIVTCANGEVTQIVHLENPRSVQ